MAQILWRISSLNKRASLALSILLLGVISISVPANWQTTAGKKTPQPELIYPNGLALDDEGNLFISDIGSHQVLKLDRRGKLSVIAGTGDGGFGGDGKQASKARLFAPHDLAFDDQGNLLIADTYNQRIRRIDRNGIISTLAGNGQSSYSGDGGSALEASLNNPQSMAFDSEGALLIGDTYNHVVRRVDRNGKIATVAGTVPGYGGDGGAANNAQINLTMAVTASTDGSFYISDAANSRIRKVTTDGRIQTIAGFGPAQDTYGGGFAGDGGPPEKAKIFSAADLKLDAAGRLYISDSGNHRIRVIGDGVITTIAGSGRQGLAGDGKEATKAELNTPQKIAIAKDGSIFIADRANHRVRKVDARGVISTIAGTGKPAGMIYDPEIRN